MKLKRSWPRPLRSSLMGVLALSLGAPSLTHSHSEWDTVDDREPMQAIAILNPTRGRTVVGKIHFRPSGDSLAIRAEIGGLVPGERYRLQVHEYGDCSAGDGRSAGKVFGTSEELIEFAVGDDGWTDVAFSHRGHTLGGGENSLLGRSVVVHHVRERVGCGTIGVAMRRQAPPRSAEDLDSAS